MTLYNDIMIGLTVGFGVGSSIGLYLMKQRSQLHAIRENNHLLAHLNSLSDTRQFILDEVVESTNCANALVLRIHNGGSKLSDGKDWYSSVVAESPERKKVSAIKDWQYKVVQDDYKSLIKRVRSKGLDYVTTETMPHGDLRTAYEAMGIIGSAVYFLYADDYYFYYMSFPVRENWIAWNDSPDQHNIKNAVLRMKRKYQKYSELGVLKFDNVN